MPLRIWAFLNQDCAWFLKLALFRKSAAVCVCVDVGANVCVRVCVVLYCYLKHYYTTEN